MKDFPCFATDDGVASLILKEIPYQQEAYIRFQDVQPGRFAPFLQECVSFCRMAGAEKIYAQGHEELSQYPLHAAVYEMRGKAWVDRELLENIFPMTECLPKNVCWKAPRPRPPGMKGKFWNPAARMLSTAPGNFLVLAG